MEKETLIIISICWTAGLIIGMIGTINMYTYIDEWQCNAYGGTLLENGICVNVEKIQYCKTQDYEYFKKIREESNVTWVNVSKAQ